MHQIEAANQRNPTIPKGSSSSSSSSTPKPVLVVCLLLLLLLLLFPLCCRCCSVARLWSETSPEKLRKERTKGKTGRTAEAEKQRKGADRQTEAEQTNSTRRRSREQTKRSASEHAHSGAEGRGHRATVESHASRGDERTASDAETEERDREGPARRQFVSGQRADDAKITQRAESSDACINALKSGTRPKTQAMRRKVEQT